MQHLVTEIRNHLIEKAGFSNKGQKIILDESVTGKTTADELRKTGYNVRSVEEIMGKKAHGVKGQTDEQIKMYAEVIGARVLTADRGRKGGDLESLELRCLGSFRDTVPRLCAICKVKESTRLVHD